jgi:hypothetical protein
MFSSTRNFAYLLHASAPLPTLAGLSPDQPFAIFPAFRVLILPTTNNPLFARVSPTFNLRLSARNPMYPDVLFRTVENIITSFSRPSNPSTVFTSIPLSCIIRWSPRVDSNRLRYLLSVFRRRYKSDIWAAYGAMTPIFAPSKFLEKMSVRHTC